MPASEAIIGKGTTIGYSVTDGGSVTLLAEVVECGQPKLVIGSVEATHYTSPSDYIEKKSAVWRDIENIPLTLNYTPDQTETLYDIAGDALFWTITLPDTSTYEFAGFLGELGGGAIPNKGIIQQTCSITVQGAVTFTGSDS